MLSARKRAGTLKARNSKQSKRNLGIEKLEDRKMMTANAYIDFTGATQEELDYACNVAPCWSDRPTEGRMMGFIEGFTLLTPYSEYSFLKRALMVEDDPAETSVKVASVTPKSSKNSRRIASSSTAIIQICAFWFWFQTSPNRLIDLNRP